MPLPLAAQRIILPSGQYAAPTKLADVVPIRPPEPSQLPAERVAAER